MSECILQRYYIVYTVYNAVRRIVRLYIIRVYNFSVFFFFVFFMRQLDVQSTIITNLSKIAVYWKLIDALENTEKFDSIN